MVKTPRLRPVVERARRALDVVRGQVPLAEPAGHIPVLLQDPRQRGAALRPRRGIPGERAGVLGDGTEANAVVVAAGEQCRTGRRAERGHVEAVVGGPDLLHPRHRRSGDRAAERVGVAEPGVVDDDDEHVRGVLGCLRAGDHRPVGDRMIDRAPHRPAEPAVRDRQHGAVRAELARRLGQGGLQLPQALVGHRGDRLRRGAGQGLLGRQPVVVIDHGDDDRGAGPQLVTQPLLDAAVQPVLGEFAGQGTDSPAHHDRSEQRR